MRDEVKKPVVAPASRSRRVAVWSLVIVILAGLGYYFFAAPWSSAQRAQRTRTGEGPVPVVAAAAKRADVPLYLEAVGTSRALNTVTVRPQVDGKLIQVAFAEGQDVKKGDVLARIDPTTFQAQLDQAIGKKAQDEAQLSNARLDLERYERLAATNSINRQQTDTQRATVAQLEALVKSDQGAIDKARAILNYTTIAAPIDGRTGLRLVDEGNIVRGSDTNGIVVLTEIRPISVFFNLPQQELSRVNKAFASGPVELQVLRSDTDEVIDKGKLTVVDNQVDQTTGTVRLKGEFPNAQLQLWPGQFVNVRLLVETLKNVVVVPTGAVQRGPRGTFVYVVKDDNTAAMRPVTIDHQDEVQAVVTQGLEAPERVVTTGFARLTEGTRVAASSSEPGAVPSAPPQGPPARRRAREGAPQR
jgi:multidrug efflux system membrane fusion protein